MPIIYSKVTVQPQSEPISLTEAKLDLRVDSSDENDLIEMYITAAREMIEKRTGRSLITQTRTVKLDYFPLMDTIKLPNGAVQSVTSITYYDKDNVVQTFASSGYWVDTDSDICRIVVDNSWPSTYDRPNAVTITYVAGYGSNSTDVPYPLRKAMLFLIGHFYENRQNVIVSGSSTGALELPMGAEYLISNYVLEQDVFY